MEPDVVEFLQQSNYIEGEYDSHSLDDAVEAWKFLIDKKHLTASAVLKTHGILMRTRELEDKYKGKIRDCNVTVGGRMCPDHKEVGGLLERWFKLCKDAKTEEEIKKAHIEFEHTHPFVDGNGRVGRIVLNWQRVKAGLPILIINEGYEQREYYKWFR